MKDTMLVNILVMRLKNKSSKRRGHSLCCLAYILDKKALKPAQKLLRDKVPSVRLYSAFCLVRYGKTEYLKQLERAVKNKDRPDLQSVAAVCLGYLENKTGVPILIRDLDDEVLIIRRRAIGSLRHATKRNFGYNPEDARRIRRRAIANWREWHKKDCRKKEGPETPAPRGLNDPETPAPPGLERPDQDTTPRNK
jgi:hypothetical protein